MRKNGIDLFIRVDADKNIGLGHFMRCFALAEAWKLNGGRVLFIAGKKSKNVLLEKKLKEARMDFVYINAMAAGAEDARQTAQLVSKDSWLVVDGYHFDGNYQKALKEHVAHLLWIDDFGHAKEYCADIVLNQDVLARSSFYKNRSSKTRLLLGTKFVLLRQDFLQWKSPKREVVHNSVNKILVVMGGGDFHNVTLKVIKALKSIPGLDVLVVIGAANPHGLVLKKEIRNAGGTFKLIQDAKNMSTFMAWADICISAAGSTCWELAFMGLPSLIVSTAENQTGSARWMHRKGLVRYLGEHSKVTQRQMALAVELMIANPGQRKKMSIRGKKMVDGQGVNRIIGIIRRREV